MAAVCVSQMSVAGFGLSAHRPRVARAAVPLALPATPLRQRGMVRVQANASGKQEHVALAVSVGAAASTLLSCGQAQAATEILSLAASDNRFSLIATLFLPVVGWVGFNILNPALTQLSNMKSSKAAVAGLGLSAAAMLYANDADAASEVAQLAASDARLSIIAVVFLPVVAWVLFNIGGPALNQLQNMSKDGSTVPGGKRKRSVAVGLGLTAASMLAAQQADAATEVAQVAARDGRLSILAVVFVPVVAWVLFNIGGPALNQLQNMSKEGSTVPGGKRKRSVAVGLGLTAASMLAVQQADAATEVAQVAARDGRLGILAVVFVPVVAWVLFNIGGPAKNQLDNMGRR